MEQVLKMIVGTKPGDLYGKYPSSNETSTISTAYNVSSKYTSNTLPENGSRYKTEIEKPSLKYTASVLD
jgi:hypothetical protein